MMNLIKSAFLALPLVLMGCAETTDQPVYTSSHTVSPDIQTGCVVVSDDYGDREVCNTQYYYVNGSPIYWDTAFGIWVSPWGYYRGGVWYRGYHPGWRNYYGHGYYHPRGFFHGGYHGGFHGGFHGGYHGGGGFHGGHGGHR